MSSKLSLRGVNVYNKDAINRAAFMPNETEEDNLFSFGSIAETPTRKHTGKLIVVNKGNKAGLNKRRENLFFAGGNSQVEYGNEIYYLDALLKAQKDDAVPTSSNSSMQIQGSSNSVGTPLFQNSIGGKTFGIDYNKVISPTSTVVPIPASKQISPMETIAKVKSTPTKTVKVTGLGLNFKPEYKPADVTAQGVTEVNKFLDLQKGSPVGDKAASAVKGAAWQAAGAAALNGISAIDTGERNGLFDTLDPVYHLAGGRESAIGNGLSDAGVALTKSGNPWLMLAGAGLKIVGGLTNAAFGMKENKQMKKAADESIASNRNFRSNATSFDDIKGPASMTGTNIYEGGWFSGDAAADKNAQYARDMANAYSWADRSIGTNVRNISADQIEDFMRNYAAFGGYFDRSKRKKRLRRI